MFGSIGGPELLLIFVLALLLFGPRKLPEIGKTIGKTLAEFKRATNDFTSSLEREVEIEKLREVKADVQAPLKALTDGAGGGLAPLAYAGRIAGRPSDQATEPDAEVATRPNGGAAADAADGADPVDSGGDGRRSG